MRARWMLMLLCLVPAIASSGAQETRDVTRAPTPPASFTPPAGLCRLWIDGVPASQQPAPTDCAIAIKNRPANATVVFGPHQRTTGNELGFTRGNGMPALRQLAPNAPRARGRDEARDHAADTTVKSTVRKPEKPQ